MSDLHHCIHGVSSRNHCGECAEMTEAMARAEEREACALRAFEALVGLPDFQFRVCRAIRATPPAPATLGEAIERGCEALRDREGPASPPRPADCRTCRKSIRVLEQFAWRKWVHANRADGREHDAVGPDLQQPQELALEALRWIEAYALRREDTFLLEKARAGIRALEVRP